MRKNIAAYGVLIGLVLAAVVALGLRWPAVPLRMGMTGYEVDSALNQSHYAIWLERYKADRGYRINRETGMWYDFGRDGMGNSVGLFVFFDKEEPNEGEVPRVVGWQTKKCRMSWCGQLKYVTGIDKK